MASLRLLERLTEFARGRFEITVVGAEPSPAYNRVLLSALLAGEMDEEACRFRGADWYAAEGIRLLSGTPATAVDLERRIVQVGQEAVPFDRLVLATGSLPVRLPISGMDLPGVVAFRDLGHVEAIRAVSRPGARAVVIGGGLLGLEAAYGLARIGVATTLLHVMDRLMERQLDARAARLVRAAMERKGVEVVLSASTAEIVGTDRVRAVRLADGAVLPSDLVVVAVGVRPNADLARAAGLATNRGVVVDDMLATSQPGVYAVGECVEHRGQVYGLVEPGYEQADVLARALVGEAAAYRGSKLATSLKVSGVPVFSAGDIADDAEGEPIILSSPAAGIYRKLVLREERLVGALLVGDVAEGRWYRDLIGSGEPVGSFRQQIMFGRACVAPAPEPQRLAA